MSLGRKVAMSVLFAIFDCRLISTRVHAEITTYAAVTHMSTHSGLNQVRGVSSVEFLISAVLVVQRFVGAAVSTWAALLCRGLVC